MTSALLEGMSNIFGKDAHSLIKEITQASNLINFNAKTMNWKNHLDLLNPIKYAELKTWDVDENLEAEHVLLCQHSHFNCSH